MCAHVRPATREDAPRIAQVHVASWRGAYRGMLPGDFLDALSVEERTATWREILGRRGVSATVVVETGDAVIGFASVGPCRDEDATARVGELWGLYVHPDAWSTGLGHQLHEAALDLLRARGFRQARLWVLTPNRRARVFYERHGWLPTGREKVEQRGALRLPETQYGRGIAP